jgi:hypothetical protein
MGRDGKLTTYVSTGMVTVGFVLMFLAWNGAANLDYVQGQVPYLLSGGMPGLGLVLTGLTLALVQEMRRSTAKVLAHLQQQAGAPAAPTAAAAPAVAAAPAATVSVPVATPAEGPAHSPAAVPDGEHVVATAATFHAPDCRVVDGRSDLTPMAPATAEARGLNACRICEPVAA